MQYYANVFRLFLPALSRTWKKTTLIRLERFSVHFEDFLSANDLFDSVDFFFFFFPAYSQLEESIPDSKVQGLKDVNRVRTIFRVPDVIKQIETKYYERVPLKRQHTD